MARANTYQTKDKKSKKGMIWIFSTIGVVLVAGIVVLGLWLGGVIGSKEKYTYFSDLSLMKINYSDLSKKITNEEKNIFVFVYNNDEFNASTGDNDDDYDQNDTEIEKQVRSLITTCENKNENELHGDERFIVYLYDTSIEGNEAILNNSSYGSPSSAPAILYFYNGEYNASVPEDLKNHFDVQNPTYTLSSSGSKTALISCLKDIKQFINNIKF